MCIEHIILPGGGPIGLYIYGALKKLNNEKFWNIEDIKSIYCTSIGGFIGIITILNLDWSWIDDFLIKRPWNKVLDVNNINYLDIITDKGLFDSNIAKNMIEPLLKAKGLDIDITLKEFYEFSNIVIYFYSTNLNSAELNIEEISYKNYPNMKLYEALYITVNIPFIFKPYFIDEKCLIDGGLVNNNPIQNCLNNEKCDLSNILFFTNSTESKSNLISNDSDIFSYIFLILSKMAINIMCRNNLLKNNLDMKNIIYCDTNNGSLNIEYWIKVLNNSEERSKVIENGYNKGLEFLNNYN